MDVHEIPSQRWEIGLGLIREGGEGVTLRGEVTIALMRGRGAPQADLRVQVSIFTEHAPRPGSDRGPHIDEKIAAAEIAAGLGMLGRATKADPRLRRLFDDFGVVIDYRYDYGKDDIRLALVREDGSFEWV